jgi:SAM-dependent methyltransferase
MHSRLGRRIWWHGRGKRSELAFWSAWMAGAPGAEEWAEDRRERLDPETAIRDSLVGAKIANADGDVVSILDVGAGPITRLGYRYPGKTLTIVPVDPLADEYDRLLREAQLEPPIRTRGVAGESLVEHFGPRSFDIAYAANSLDHSADPLLIVDNMLRVVRPGGAVLLRHRQNEGERERYEGLHQWNFDCVEGALIFWNNATRLDVGAAVAGRGTTEAWIEDGEVLARITAPA